MADRSLCNLERAVKVPVLVGRNAPTLPLRRSTRRDIDSVVRRDWARDICEFLTQIAGSGTDLHERLANVHQRSEPPGSA